ncbi:MAG: DoxX family protein [Planctomycetota bacterium]
MEYFRSVLPAFIGWGILNVWLLRFNKSTPYRGGAARNMKEEFAAYGLPEWLMWVVGGLKVVLALSLLASFWRPELLQPAALGMAALMLGAVGMHLKIGDSRKKTAPALSVLILSLIAAFV